MMKISLQTFLAFLLSVTAYTQEPPIWIPPGADEFYPWVESLKRASGCFLDEPKSFEEFLKFLPPQSEGYGWCCSQFPIEIDGIEYGTSTFRIETPPGFEEDLTFEFLEDMNSIIPEKTVFAARVYLQTSEGSHRYILEGGSCFQDLLDEVLAQEIQQVAAGNDR